MVAHSGLSLLEDFCAYGIYIKRSMFYKLHLNWEEHYKTILLFLEAV